MTEIERKALALVNEIERQEGLSDFTPRIMRGLVMDEALCRAIEQHEAFKREVSEAVADAMDDWPVALPLQLFIALENLKRFIIAKPDPLAECLLELDLSEDEQEARHDAEWLVKTIEKRGGKLTWGEG